MRALGSEGSPTTRVRILSTYPSVPQWTPSLSPMRMMRSDHTETLDVPWPQRETQSHDEGSFHLSNINKRIHAASSIFNYICSPYLRQRKVGSSSVQSLLKFDFLNKISTVLRKLTPYPTKSECTLLYLGVDALSHFNASMGDSYCSIMRIYTDLETITEDWCPAPSVGSSVSVHNMRCVS
ncbi:hypothetical protein E2C01_023964 [Portunus trituberculatus]|uniref:Uncharacterized protein n=1 Tax=Portunus trituberculatus TaxID=210409 RepID=A0A5B7ED47_PORTR|nr:hypothetical protein [Portunus trituberculatus]